MCGGAGLSQRTKDEARHGSRVVYDVEAQQLPRLCFALSDNDIRPCLVPTFSLLPDPSPNTQLRSLTDRVYELPDRTAEMIAVVLLIILTILRK